MVETTANLAVLHCIHIPAAAHLGFGLERGAANMVMVAEFNPASALAQPAAA
jgi:hypothetical protein